MRTSYIALALAVALSACSRTPDPVTVQPGIPGQQQVIVQPQVVQPQDPGVVYQQQPQVVQAQPQVVYQQAPQPVIVQQQHDNSGLVTGMVLGGLVGHTLGSANNNSRETTVIRETVYRDANGRYRDDRGRFTAAPTAQAPLAAPVPAAVVPQKLNVRVAAPAAPAPVAAKVAAPAPVAARVAPPPAPKVSVRVAAPAPASKK